MEYKASDEDNKMFVHFTTLGFQADNILIAFTKRLLFQVFFSRKAR